MSQCDQSSPPSNFWKARITDAATPEFVASIIHKLQDTLALSFHCAKGIRIDRRLALARSVKWGTTLTEACGKVDSSAAFDAELFGPEFRQLFHQEAKNWKHHKIISAMENPKNQNHHPNNSFGQGKWSCQDRSMSINWRELQAVVHALDENAVSWRGKTALVRSDNVTTCALINKQGSRFHAHLHKLACKLLYLCQTHRIRIFARHVAGKDNQVADVLSRQTLNPQHEVLCNIE
jgi:hypothetical protein